MWVRWKPWEELARRSSSVGRRGMELVSALLRSTFSMALLAVTRAAAALGSYMADVSGTA